MGDYDSLNLKQHIGEIPDFPEPGILFYDISPLLAHHEAWRQTVARLAEAIKPHKPDVLAGIESRGFLVAAPLALALNLGFVMVRKRGKLPGPTTAHQYDLEYGTDTVEIQTGSVAQGQRVVVLDDLLATGGTLAAAISLLTQAGADVVGAACVIELTFLNGRNKLNVPFTSLLRYDQ